VVRLEEVQALAERTLAHARTYQELGHETMAMPFWLPQTEAALAQVEGR